VAAPPSLPPLPIAFSSPVNSPFYAEQILDAKPKGNTVHGKETSSKSKLTSASPWSPRSRKQQQ